MFDDFDQDAVSLSGRSGQEEVDQKRLVGMIRLDNSVQ